MTTTWIDFEEAEIVADWDYDYCPTQLDPAYAKFESQVKKIAGEWQEKHYPELGKAVVYCIMSNVVAYWANKSVQGETPSMQTTDWSDFEKNWAYLEDPISAEELKTIITEFVTWYENTNPEIRIGVEL